jgi:hypothetical protein
VYFVKKAPENSGAPSFSGTSTNAGNGTPSALIASMTPSQNSGRTNAAMKPSTSPTSPAPSNLQQVNSQAFGGNSPQTNSNPKPAQSSPGTMSQPAFISLTNKTLDELPTLNEASKLNDEDAHELPQAFIDKVQGLGDIAQAVADNPSLEGRAIEFYRTCARDAHYLPAARARCLAHLRKLSDKHHEPVNMNEYPAQIRKLSEIIP